MAEKDLPEGKRTKKRLMKTGTRSSEKKGKKKMLKKFKGLPAWSEISTKRKIARVFFIFLLPVKILLLIFGVNFGITYLIEEIFTSTDVADAMIGSCMGSC